MNKANMNHTVSITNSEMLEETLSSFGALAAVSAVRRCFPDSGNFQKRFGQRHDGRLRQR